MRYPVRPDWFSEYDLFVFFPCLQVLNLHGNGLSRLKHVNCMTALKKLVLSFNELSRLDDISHMVRQTQTHDLAFGFF